MSDINRDSFENWYIQNWHDGDIHPHQSLLNHKPSEDEEYVSQAIQNMWEAWQAASSLILEGFAIVPIEPTDEMQNAARDWSVATLGHAVGGSGSRGCYQAMINAAPKPTDK